MIPNGHVTMSTGELLNVIDEIRDRVAAGDSFEGHVEYLMPGPLELDPDADFAVRAAFRVGNLMGQGGMTLIQTNLAECPSCNKLRPRAISDGVFEPGSVCPHCGHVEPETGDLT